MERLSDEERQIIVLHAVAGFKHREIGEMLDLALPTVLSKYHRAIKKLRAYL
jgi:RNA polymerase sigma-70 factor (ECF subfamily)